MSNRPNKKSSPSQRVAQARTSSSGGSTTWIWIAVAVVVVVAVGVTIVVVARNNSSGGSASAPAGSTIVPKGQLAFGDIAVQGTNLPAFTQGSPDPAIGTAAPGLTGEGFDGKAMTIPAAGTPKVIMFVAHWCPHCQKEVPLLVTELNAKGMPAGVDLYAVATGTNESRPNFPPANWLNKEGWAVPTMVDTEGGKAAEAFGVNGFPYFVAVDAQGNVVARTSGEISMEQFNQLVNAAKTGQPIA